MASMAGDARPLRFTVSPAGTALAFASTGNAAASPRSGTGRLDEPLAEVGDVEQERSAGQLQLHFAIVLRVGLTVQMDGYGRPVIAETLRLRGSPLRHRDDGEGYTGKEACRGAAVAF